MSRMHNRITAGILAMCMTGMGVPMTAVPYAITAHAEETVYEEGIKLTENTTIDGDLRLKGGTLNLNGYTLTVKGDFWHAGGIVEVGTGTLKVTGNYQMRSSSSSYSTGELRMTLADGVVDVDGDVVIDTNVEVSGYQWNGVMRVGGNFTCYAPLNGAGYTPTESMVTEFKGNVVHEVTFNNTISHLSTVRVTDGGSLLLKDQTRGFTLDSDANFADGSQIVGDRTLKLNGNTLTVTGDFRQDGNAEVNLNGSKMIVEGDYWHAGGILNVQSGTLEIGGDYQMRSSSSSYSTGELRMTVSDGVVDVDGDVVIDTNVEASGYQWNGVVHVGGNFTCYAPLNGAGYTPTASMVTEFKGNVVHEVTFNNTISHLSTVRVTDGGSLLLKDKTRGFTLDSDANFADGSQIVGDRTLKLNGYTVTVTGDFRQDGNAEVDLNGSRMYVAGDYWHAGGILNVQSGTLNIAGDYQMRSSSSSYSTGELRMTTENGRLITGGDVVIDSNVENSGYQWNGVVSVGGDFRCYAPLNGKGYAPTDSLVTEFRGGKAHEVEFNNTLSFLSTIQLGAGDSITFTNGLAGISRGSAPAVTVDPETLADVSDLTVTGKTEGEGTIKFSNGSDSKTKTFIVGASDTEAVFDGKTVAVTPSSVLRVKIGGGTEYLVGEYADVPLTITGDIPDDAWITFVPSDTPHTEKDGDDANEPGKWQYLKDVENGIAHFEAPSKTGAYDIRVYDGDDPATAKEIAYKSVQIVEKTSSTEPPTTEPVKETEEPADAKEMPGDVNLDGTVDIMDVISINRYLLGSNKLGPVAKKNADVDGSNTIDTTDSLLILKYVVEIIDSFGTEPTQPTEATEPTSPPVSSELGTIVSTYNTAAVESSPTEEATFTVDQVFTVYSIMTYHWNDGKGTESPGKIALLEDGVSMGNWQTVGEASAYNAPNNNWLAYPTGLVLRPGHVYTVVDSDPDTWSYNASSQNAGFFEIKGYAGASETEPTEPTGGTVDFTGVKIQNYQERVPANSNAFVELDLSGNTDLSGSDAWLGLIPVGTGTSELEADAVDIAYTYLRDATYQEDDHISVGVFVPQGTPAGEYELRVYANDSGGALVDRVTITVIEENTLTFRREEIGWYKNDDGVPCLSISFDYTGEILKGSRVRIMFVPAGTPHDDWASVDGMGGQWASAFQSAGGDYTSVGLPDKTEGEWELRAYSDVFNGARELDSMPIPAYELD